MLKTFILRDEQAAQSLWALLKNNWRALAEQGKPLAVTVAEHKSKRNKNQNARYWAILNQVENGAWVNGKKYNAQVWHEYFAAKFIGMEETPDNRRIGISTTTLSVAEFCDYMGKVEAHAVDELGVLFEFKGL